MAVILLPMESGVRMDIRIWPYGVANSRFTHGHLSLVRFIVLTFGSL
jgi:hypothetical protein